MFLYKVVHKVVTRLFTRLLQGCLQGCYKVVTRLLQGCYKEPGCNKVVAQPCCNLVTTLFFLYGLLAEEAIFSRGGRGGDVWHAEEVMFSTGGDIWRCLAEEAICSTGGDVWQRRRCLAQEVMFSRRQCLQDS